MGKINILQISDLHRSRANQVRTPALLDSISTDLLYQIHEVERIDIIAVCGDIVQGVRSADIARVSEIDTQYAEASDFLVQLCDKFVEGDRERVVIVPGNHDVSWPHSEKSMRLKSMNLESGERKLFIQGLIREMRAPEYMTRWSWDELCFMEIQEQSVYTERMEQFRQFYNSFYNDLRTYSATPDSQFSIHDYPKLNITVLGLNSCDSLDHCNPIGRFNPDALAKSLTELKKPLYNPRVKIAVLHHGLYGPPYQSDYLDPLSMQNLIVNRFSIGLHGHQHVPDFVAELGRFGHDSKMLVIGTGTLCGTPETLPPGQMRNYNLISIDIDKENVSLYPREMKQSNFETPVWGKKYLPYTNIYPIVEKVYIPQHSAMQGASITDSFNAIADAEHLIGLKEYHKAVEILEKSNPADDLVRRLLVECYSETGRYDRLVEILRQPSSVHEAIYALDAADELNDKQLIKELLSNQTIAKSTDPALSELRKKLERRIR
jgi:predicted phosphodiesterase